MKLNRKLFSPGKFVVLALLATVSPSVSQANIYGFLPCASGLQSDSFGMGQYAGLTAEFPLPAASAASLDAQCLHLGIEAGQALRSQSLFGGSLNITCQGDLRLGEQAGMELNGLTGSDCFRAGYLYGAARRTVGAR